MNSTTKTLIVVFLSLRTLTLLLSPAQAELDTWGSKTRHVDQHLEQVWLV